jgi:RHS repeat-associated protein
VTPTYDGNGNLTYDGAFTYAYDAESRLTSIQQGATTVAAYLYDGQGRRKTKTVGSTTTVYTTDADNREVLENDGSSGQVRQWYAYGSGIDEPLNQMALTASTRVTFIPDIQGSVMATLDAASGTLTKAAYLPFGENPTNYSGTFRYTSRRIDPETGGSTAQPSGLYYYRARMYSPTWGRFLQADPVGYAAGPNLYAYVGNDPLNAVDPGGLTTYFGQVGASVIGVLGGVANGGIYITSNNAYGLPDVGLFKSVGPAVGLGAGLSATVGYANGSISDFRGRTLNIDASASVLTATASFSPAGASTFSNYVGASAGLSFGTPGGDVSTTTTKAAGFIENAIIPGINSVYSAFTGAPLFTPSTSSGSTQPAPTFSSTDGGKS